MEQDKHKDNSALNVNKGIEQPPTTNPKARERMRQFRRQKPEVKSYIDGILAGDSRILGQAITLIESQNQEHRGMAQNIIEACLPYAGKSLRIGITGVPGVGKSTFIEALGQHITKLGHKLAVLAIDPSSERSKGSIMGDKTRMEELVANPKAFIRPSATAGSLGGVANKTRESIILCEAAGYDTIFIETVGVGQSETAVHSMVDFFLLLMLAGAGDELQGIKRGIMEMADAIVITKADAGNQNAAQKARTQYQNALHLFPPKPSGWEPKVTTCSSVTQQGIPQVWELTDNYFGHIKANGFMQASRQKQARNWMYETLNEGLQQHFYQDKARKKQVEEIEQRVLAGKISAFQAAQWLLKNYTGNR